MIHVKGQWQPLFQMCNLGPPAFEISGDFERPLHDFQLRPGGCLVNQQLRSPERQVAADSDCDDDDGSNNDDDL